MTGTRIMVAKVTRSRRICTNSFTTMAQRRRKKPGSRRGTGMVLAAAVMREAPYDGS